MTKTEFEEKLEWFLDFYGQTITRLQCQVWFQLFGNLSITEFSAALNYHIRTDLYNSFPAPGKITAALEAIEDEARNRKPDYPEFSTMWCRIVKHFPDMQHYEHFPPEPITGDPSYNEHLTAWKELYDKVVMVPESRRVEAVEEVMRELEEKY